MIEEALQYTSGLAVRAAAPQKVETGDARSTTVVIDGKIQTIEKPIAPRQHKVESLVDLVTIVKRFSGGEGESAEIDGKASPCKPVVWFSPAAVVAVLDDNNDRLERVQFTLAGSDAFQTVHKLRDGKHEFEVPDLCRFLRVELAGAIRDADLHDRIKKIAFEGGEITRSESGRGKESLGREITASVRPEQEIPEVVTLSVPVFKNAGERDRYPVLCTVDAMPMKGKIRLIPVPDEIERVVQMAMKSIQGRLFAELPESVPAYYGAP